MPEEQLSITQRNVNSGGGPVAAGNIAIDNSQHLHVTTTSSGESYLGHLYRKLEKEMEANKCIEVTHELLADLTTTDEDEVVGLEKKLANGGMTYHLNYAKNAKERYAKLLYKYSMFESAQIIHAYLLSKVESGYQSSVLPHLQATPPSQKLELMRKAVLEPLEAILGHNPLDLHPKHIDGMVFFLTGKCRLKWEA